MTKKIKQKLSNTLRLTFRCLKIIHFFHPRYYPKRYSRKRTKNKCVCFKDVIWLMAMIIRLKMKSIIQRYGINRPGPRHGHKCTNYQMCLSIRTVINIKQHLSNIWSSIYEKVKQHWGWIKESDVYKKKACIYMVNFVPAMPESRLEQTGLRLARTRWKTFWPHINATTNLCL